MIVADSWSDIIRRSYVVIGVREANEPLQDAEAEDGFSRLKSMLSEWGTDGLLVPGLVRLNHSLSGDKRIYTIGPAVAEGDEDSVAPDIACEKPVETITVLNYRRYGQLNTYAMEQTSLAVLSANKSEYGHGPNLFYYEQSHPFAMVHFNALPYDNDSVEIVGRGHFPDFALADSPSDILPVGYEEAVILCLADKLAPENAVIGQRRRELRKDAMMAKNIISKRNVEIPESNLDPAVVGGRSDFRYGNAWRGGRGRWGWC